MKTIYEMEAHEFLDLPFIDKPEQAFDSIIIIPSQELHDSGFNEIICVGVNKNTAVGIVCNFSDIIYIDGITGCGRDWLTQCTKAPVAWSIDCLPKSQLLRLFIGTPGFKISTGRNVSSFEVFSYKESNQ